MRATLRRLASFDALLAGLALALMLVLPLLGVVMVLGETIGDVVTDPRLRARHAFAKKLRYLQVTRDLQL